MSERSPQESTFPHWVALGSLIFTLGLFFANTVPAVREHQSLRAVEQELSDLRHQYEQAIASNAWQVLPSGQDGRRPDLQALLVAIDEQGYTPLELCTAFPLRTPEVPGVEPDNELAEPR